MTGFLMWLKHALTGPHKLAADRVERVDAETREVRHTLRNVQMRTDALHHLISRMRDDGTFAPEKARRDR